MKRNREISVLKDSNHRRNAKSKRIQHILKKIQELSILCELQINLNIYDEQFNKLIEYATDKKYGM